MTLEEWMQERREAPEGVESVMSQRKCDFGPPFEVKSPPGTQPTAVDAPDNTAIDDALEAFGLTDYDPESGPTVVFGRAPETRGNWIVNEALKFIDNKNGKTTCMLRVTNGWDPRFKYFETLFRVELLGCFENSDH